MNPELLDTKCGSENAIVEEIRMTKRGRQFTC